MIDYNFTILKDPIACVIIIVVIVGIVIQKEEYIVGCLRQLIFTVYVVSSCHSQEINIMEFLYSFTF